MTFNEAKNTPRRTGHRTLRMAAAVFALLQATVLCTAPIAGARANANPGTEEGGGSANPVTPPPYVYPVEGFTWSAPQRYSYWTTAWHEWGGAPKPWQTETYNDDYVNPKTWYLYFNGCQSEADYYHDFYGDVKDEDGHILYPKGTSRYQWKWNGKTIAPSTDCYTVLDFPAQGNYWVELTETDADNAVTTWTIPVQVKDYLVVVLGDSFASGEGAVDWPIYPEIPNDPPQNADWADDRCHRSMYSGGAQAAALLEAADPKTSVTFLSFACSGATLDTMRYNTGTLDTLDPYNPTLGFERGTGITGPYAGMEPPPNGVGPYEVASQTVQLNYALTGHLTHPPRKVDTLIAAGGINDVRFSDLVGVCILEDLCHLQPVGTGGVQLDQQFANDLENVAPGWEKLGDQLDGYGIQVAPHMKLALEYPGFFQTDSGLQCPELFTDITALGKWDFDEIGVAEAVWAPSLNTAVQLGSGGAGFDFVGGIDAAFKKHGMCANDRFINTATDALNTQGDENGNVANPFHTQSSTTGTAHPNRKGYAAVAAKILDHLQPYIVNEPPVANPDEVQAAAIYGSQFNVLTNDTDPDGDPLSARLVSEPRYGHVTIAPNGEASYRANFNYAGPDNFTYEVTDGEYSVITGVTITVAPLQVATTEVSYGTITPIGGLLGGFVLEPPYLIVFDKPLKPKRGLISQVPGVDAVMYSAPDLAHRRRLKLPYTIYSQAAPPSTAAGSSVRGMLQIKVMK
ncbi:MAG TPA: Ig-like domain-containing protein [Candidatus Limnocylindrales bacterium]|nr:Ig-like domain-containing protein [Candidatus Limnocylindrales bacterium]